jgi:hypothetical protein
MRTLSVAVLGLTLVHFGPAVVAQGAWKPITGGGMSVSAPCTGDWDTTTHDVPEAAMVVTNHNLGCKTGDSLYLVGWTEIATKAPIDGMTEVRASRDAMLKQAGGAVLLTSNDIVHDGIQGIEFTANLRGTVLLSCRTLFKGNRLYLVSVGTPLNQDRSADIKRLLTSIKIAR